jgi:hypothetical protein
MSPCRHRRSHRAAATALPPLRCAPPPQHRRQAANNVALSRCRHRLAAAKLPPTSRFRAAHRRSCRAASTALPPSRCAPLPSCRRPCAVALPPPPLPPPPRRISLVGCCVVVRHPLPSGLFCLFGKTGGGLFEVIQCIPFPDTFKARDIRWAA